MQGTCSRNWLSTEGELVPLQCLAFPVCQTSAWQCFHMVSITGCSTDRRCHGLPVKLVCYRSLRAFLVFSCHPLMHSLYQGSLLPLSVLPRVSWLTTRCLFALCCWLCLSLYSVTQFLIWARHAPVTCKYQKL